MNNLYYLLIIVCICAIILLVFRKKVKSSFVVFLKYRNLLFELVSRDIKIKYKRSVLGIVWSVLNPLLMMMILYFVFSRIFRNNIENFPVYLLTGQVIFNFFSDSTTQAMNSILNSGSLIKKIYIPKYIFPFSKVLSGYVNLFYSLAALLIVMLITHVKFTWAMLLFPIPLVYLLFFALGIGPILAAYVVKFRDILFLYGVMLTAWIYLTPIFYSEEVMIDSQYLFFYKLNPMYHYVTIFREIVLFGRVPSFEMNLICVAFSLFFLFVGMLLFYKKQNEFVLYV